jgi:hypothetical protein
MGTVCTSETSVHFNVITRRYIPEDSKLHTRRRENLISHKWKVVQTLFLVTVLLRRWYSAVEDIPPPSQPRFMETEVSLWCLDADNFSSSTSYDSFQYHPPITPRSPKYCLFRYSYWNVMFISHPLPFYMASSSYPLHFTIPVHCITNRLFVTCRLQNGCALLNLENDLKICHTSILSERRVKFGLI